MTSDIVLHGWGAVWFVVVREASPMSGTQLIMYATELTQKATIQTLGILLPPTLFEPFQIPAQGRDREER